MTFLEIFKELSLYFNSTIVQLKVPFIALWPRSGTLFQFYNSAIKRIHRARSNPYNRYFNSTIVQLKVFRHM